MRPTSGRKNQGKLPGEAMNARQKKKDAQPPPQLLLGQRCLHFKRSAVSLAQTNGLFLQFFEPIFLAGKRTQKLEPGGSPYKSLSNSLWTGSIPQ